MKIKVSEIIVKKRIREDMGDISLLMESMKKNGLFNPITITDKKMTRFTMTPQEAVNLILSTVELAKGGEVFVLKMKVMRIIDLVQAMIELYGKNGKIEITEIGKRQG